MNSSVRKYSIPVFLFIKNKSHADLHVCSIFIEEISIAAKTFDVSIIWIL
jgi:hypothetical protein